MFVKCILAVLSLWSFGALAFGAFHLSVSGGAFEQLESIRSPVFRTATMVSLVGLCAVWPLAVIVLWWVRQHEAAELAEAQQEQEQFVADVDASLCEHTPTSAELSQLEAIKARLRARPSLLPLPPSIACAVCATPIAWEALSAGTADGHRICATCFSSTTSLLEQREQLIP